jgi:hypothetical protein
MNERFRRAIFEAEFGDLRPQVNPHAAPALARLPEDLNLIEPVLIDRLFQLSRLIADASARPGQGARLGDAGPFFYLIDTLLRLGYPRLEETLLVVLDEFSQLTERSYDELFLWCIIQLSRTDLRHVELLWPQAIALDLRYRPAAWRRPRGARVFDLPYRLTDLIFYFFRTYTLTLKDPWTGKEYPSLGACLRAIGPGLAAGERALVRTALEELREGECRAAYSDALSLFRFLFLSDPPAPPTPTLPRG